MSDRSQEKKKLTNQQMACMCSFVSDAEIFAKDILTSAQTLRMKKLDRHLTMNGLRRPIDSRLCFHYIMCGGTCDDIILSDIAIALKKANYLHQKCSFSSGHRLAHLNMQRHTMSVLDHTDYLAFIRRCVLLTTESRAYPESL